MCIDLLKVATLWLSLIASVKVVRLKRAKRYKSAKLQNFTDVRMVGARS